MKIIKKSNQDIKKEAAHGGSGTRKLYIAEMDQLNQNTFL